MEYPQDMIQFKDQIRDVSKYLTDMRDKGRFNDISKDALMPLFGHIINEIAPDQDNKAFIDGFTEVFIINAKNLYSEVGKCIAVHNEAFVASITYTCLMAILAAVQEAEEEFANDTGEHETTH